MTPRRVTLVCSSSAWGGTEKWALRAAEYLQNRGVEITFAGRSPSVFAPYARAEMPFLQLPFLGEADVVTILRLAAHLRLQDAVILTRVRDYWLGGLAARAVGIPALLRLGIVRRLRDKYPMDRLRYGVLPSSILVNAQPIADKLRETPWMKSMPISVVSNGVDAPGPARANEKEEARKALAVPASEILIVGTGRLAEAKRWHLLVQAVAELKKKKTPVRAVVLGEGDQRISLEAKIAEQGVGDRISLPGHTHDLDRWLAAADIFALPSDNEGISNSLLEAMGRGLPCVITTAGGARDYFKDGNEVLMADTDDVDGFIARIIRLVENPASREQVGNKGLAMVRRQFTWERMTDGLIDVLNKLSTGPE